MVQKERSKEADALPPVLDVEFQPTSRTCRRKLSREETIAKMRLMLREMEHHYRKKPIIYVTVDFYAEMMHPNEFSEYPTWVRSTKYEPSVHYPAAHGRSGSISPMVACRA